MKTKFFHYLFFNLILFLLFVYIFSSFCLVNFSCFLYSLLLGLILLIPATTKALALEIIIIGGLNWLFYKWIK